MTSRSNCERRASRSTVRARLDFRWVGAVELAGGADLTTVTAGARRSGSAIAGKCASPLSQVGARSMRARRIAIPLAALLPALLFGCEGQPDKPPTGHTDAAARDARPDRSDASAAADARARMRPAPTVRAPTRRASTTSASTPPPTGRRTPRAREARPASTGRLATRASTASFELLGAPLVFAPTSRGFGVSVVLRAGDPTALQMRVRDEDLVVLDAARAAALASARHRAVDGGRPRARPPLHL